MSRSVNGLSVRVDTPEIHHYLTLLIFLYADYTILFGASAKNLQHSLSVFENYCKEWHLIVNVLKTKVLIFSNSKHKKFTSLEGKT